LNNVDDKNFIKTFSKCKNYIVYHGSFFSEGAENADLILPLHSVFENDYKYINIEGRLRKTLTVLNYNSNNVTVEELFKFLSIIGKTYLPNSYSNFNNFDKVIEYFKFVDKDVSTSKNESLSFDLHKDVVLQYKVGHLLGED
jgi:NADH dehydrogenase/NADH:ubiquinone oxidoreductase subunit G